AVEGVVRRDAVGQLQEGAKEGDVLAGPVGDLHGVIAAGTCRASSASNAFPPAERKKRYPPAPAVLDRAWTPLVCPPTPRCPTTSPPCRRWSGSCSPSWPGCAPRTPTCAASPMRP